MMGVGGAGHRTKRATVEPSGHAEIRMAVASGTMPTSWATASGRAPPPPCTADRYHHWSEEPADDALAILYRIRYVDKCVACKLRRIRLKGEVVAAGGRSGGKIAYAPNLEYVIWLVSCRGHMLARNIEVNWIAEGLPAPRGGGGGGRSGGKGSGGGGLN